MFLLSRNTPYSNLYVSTPLENRGNLMRVHFVVEKYGNDAYIRGPTIAEIPSLIKLRLPMHVTGYVNDFPMQAANICTTCATYPRAAATVSSLTSLCSDNVNGGAGSLGVTGIGNGTSSMVNNRSDGEDNSIGNIADSLEIREVRRDLIW
jgi:hypothetical protein